MKRANLGLAFATSAVAVLALVYGINSHRATATATEPKGQDTRRSQQISPIGAKPSKSTAVVQPQSSDGGQERTHPKQGQPDTMVFSPDGSIADEGATREGVRKVATDHVQRRYALLLQDLDLTPRERDDLFALLVEDRIASTSTPYKQSKSIDEQEQSRRIAAIIGDRKLRQFRELESNLRQYAEVHNIASLLEKNGVPLTGAQRDGLLKVVIETHDKYAATPPPGHLEPDSIEFFEHQMTRKAEYERHLMELMPSVLSGQQVVYLDQQYQYLSYRRTQALEQRREELADGIKAEDSQVWYPAW